ncbi:MAG: DUF1674 domain-containing protein [Gammaproteobacteria bacterium]
MALSTSMSTSHRTLSPGSAPAPDALSPAGGHETPSATDIPAATPAVARSGASLPTEIGGRDGPEPTRFGDWERAGRCIDF